MAQGQSRKGQEGGDGSTVSIALKSQRYILATQALRKLPFPVILEEQ